MSNPYANTSHPGEWWRTAVIYEIYIRSFADSDADGVGDIGGIRSRLPYLADLGVDALWITPWYPSPMADGGYDITDYRGIAPELGNLSQARELLTEAHQHGIRIILDLVPNHTSTHHPWFQRAAISDAATPDRSWYWFRPGREPNGTTPPNNWTSVFGGSAWTRLPTTDNDPEPEWYLHLFDIEQPDLNWTNPDVADQFDNILRFWFDLGVDGLRIDVAHGLAKHPDLPDLPIPDTQEASEMAGADVVDHPHWDRDDSHETFRRWRRIADAYAGTQQGPRMFVAEAWRIRPGGLSRYLRSDELHTAFSFDLVKAAWDPQKLRAAIERQLQTHAPVNASPTWMLSSHDLIRPVTRYARTADHSQRQPAEGAAPVDIVLGTRRALAAALLMLALPGSAYIYQGEELGLPEVEDIPEDALQDPMWHRSEHRTRGRDGCRVPLPWTEDGPTFGFSTAHSWLPQPPDWGKRAVTRQADDPESPLALYRHAIQTRHHRLNPDQEFRWREEPDGTVAFDRGDHFTCIANLTNHDLPLTTGSKLLLSSRALTTGVLPADTTVWLDTRPKSIAVLAPATIGL